jgi:hypothetical protein
MFAEDAEDSVCGDGSGFFRAFNFVIQILLVGHSMAGFSVLDAMERFHRILKVYISAVLLPSGQ